MSRHWGIAFIMLSEKNTQTRSSKLKSAVWSVKLKDFILVLHQMLHGVIVNFLLWNLMFFTHATIINNCDCWSSLFEKAIQILKGYILIQWWQGILQNKMLKTEYWRMNKKNCSTASRLFKPLFWEVLQSRRKYFSKLKILYREVYCKYTY